MRGETGRTDGEAFHRSNYLFYEHGLKHHPTSSLNYSEQLGEARVIVNNNPLWSAFHASGYMQKVAHF
jgi:hypothetical protein